MHHSLGLDPDPRHFFLDEEAAVHAVVLLAWPEEAQADPRGAASSARAALRRWVAMGLPVRRDEGGEGGGRVRFDIAHVVNFMRDAGLDGRDPVFPSRTVPVFRRQAARAMDLLPTGQSGCPSPTRRFRVSFRREFNLARSPGIRPLRLRLPLPYDDPTQRLLDVSVTAPPGAATVRRTAGCVEAVLPRDRGAATATVEARIELAAARLDGAFNDTHATTGAGTDAERGLYLNPSERLIQVTPAVRRLAAELAPPGGASVPTGVRSMLEGFWDFFHSGALRHGYIRHGELDGADPLPDMVRRGWFDCLGGACLLVALCRAKQVPARLVHGLILHELAPTFHFWAEVRAEDGWLPVDLASWDHAEGRPGIEPWSRLFLGRLEPRMKLECFPRRIAGPVGVAFPAAWSVVRTPAPDGACTSTYDAATGGLAYRDTVRVVRVG